MDWLLRVVGFEEEELGDYRCGHSFVDFAIKTDNSFLDPMSDSYPKWIYQSNSVHTFNSLEKISSGLINQQVNHLDYFLSTAVVTTENIQVCQPPP